MSGGCWDGNEGSLGPLAAGLLNVFGLLKYVCEPTAKAGKRGRGGEGTVLLLPCKREDFVNRQGRFRPSYLETRRNISRLPWRPALPQLISGTRLTGRINRYS